MKNAIVAALLLATVLTLVPPLASAGPEIQGRVDVGILVEYCEYDVDTTQPIPHEVNPRDLAPDAVYCQPQL